MSPRAFLVLLALTLVALVGTIGVVAVQPRLSTADATAGDPMFGSLTQRIADIQKVVIQAAAYKVTWEKRNGGWVATDHGDYPAKEGTVATVVSGLAAMTRVEPKTDNPAWYQYIQVAEPSPAQPAGGAHVTASAANGDVLADTIVGSTSATIAASHSRGGTFVRNATQPQSWLVEGTVAIPADMADWFDPVMAIPGTDVVSVAVLIGDKTVFAAHKPDMTAGQYKIDSIDPSVGSSDKVPNDTKIRNLVAGIVNVAVLDVRPVAGLNPGPSARTDRFVTTNGMQLDVTLVDADGTTWAIFKASAPAGTDGAKAAATINAVAGHGAFKVASGATAGLAIKVTDLVQAPGAQPGIVSTPPPGIVFPVGKAPAGVGLGSGTLPFGQANPGPSVNSGAVP